MSTRKWIVAAAVVMLLVSLSCNLVQPAALAPTESPTTQPSPTATNATDPAASDTPPPTTTQSQATETTGGPQCTVLQDLNLRTGPGTAYRPPVRALPEDTRVTPIGFNSQGIPGGPWVQVRIEAANEIGWLSAGDQFISCNIDLTTLPTVNVAPPPPPPPPETENSTPEGDFPPNLIFLADFNPQYFVRMFAYDSNVGNQDGDGIESVTFTVTDANDNQVYQRTEQQSGYCIFGGGEPTCNLWTLENFVYKWTPGGQTVRDGQYELAVRVVLDSGDEGNWRYEIDLDLP